VRRTLAVSAVVVVIYLLSGLPHDGDLAAQTARADIFGRLGYVPWFAGWYAGTHLAGYSLLTPPLMWWLYPAGLGALVLAVTGPLGLLVLRAGRARRPVLGAVVLSAAQLGDLLSGRITFAAGAAVLLAATLAAERKWWLWAGIGGALAAVTSPVDGLAAGVVAGVLLLAGPDRRREGWALGAGAAVGLAAVVLPFPDPGNQPFPRASLLAALLVCAIVAVLPVGRRMRLGALLSVVLLLAAYLVHTPVGSNAARMPLLLAAPAVAAAVRAPVFLLVPALVVLLPFPVNQLRNDLSAAGDPAAAESFYAPLLARLVRAPTLELASHRLEVVEPRTHWQVVYLEPAFTLARGWERQLDVSLNPLFYGGALTPASYREFLVRNAVSAVALPVGTPIDDSSTAEAGLVRSGLSYLREIWSDPHWVLYAVRDPVPVAAGDGAGGVHLTGTGLRLDTAGPGRVALRLRYSHYLTVDGGCVARGAGGDVVLHLTRGGLHTVHAVWSWSGLAGSVLGRPAC
jgi:hypothetical protein